MRRINAAVAALAAALLVGGLLLGGTAVASSSAAVPAKKKPPVKLSGKVNNEGTKKVKSGKIEVELDDFDIKPTFIQGKPGQKVTVELKNEGSTNHTFTIDSENVDKELSPGKKAKVEVTIPDHGATNFYCRFHKSSGMQGALFTKAGASAKSSGSGGGYGY